MTNEGRGGSRSAERIVAELFADAGWEVTRDDAQSPDLVVRRGDVSYAVEVKTGSEGRSDRLIPLWSQAFLEATRAAGDRHGALAVVAAPRIPPRVAEQVLEFAATFAPRAGAAVIDFAGLRMFRGEHLEGLAAEGIQRRDEGRRAAIEPTNIFSDRNQWMLKVLLAPELPDSLLSAPRVRCRNASELARAAAVSVMSASRLVRQLRREGHLHETRHYLYLVRREELFRRWQAAAARPAREARLRFLLPGDTRAELKRLVGDGSGCLALFAAADALDVGFVRGIPPYVYVQRMGADASRWRNVVHAEHTEAPDVIVREAPAPESVFRGAVRRESLPVCDVVQVWLDVSSHPSRGQEQADLIRRRILDPIIRSDE